MTGEPGGGFVGGQGEPEDGHWFGAASYPQPPVISAPPLRDTGKVNLFATLSMVFAFVCAPVGALLGHLGLAQIRRTGQPGRDRALIGLTLSYTFVVLTAAALVLWIAVGMRHQSPPVAAAVEPPAPRPPAPEQPFVTAAQLPTLLLSLDEVTAAVNAPNLAEVSDSTALGGSGDVTVTPPQCLGALFAGMAESYRHSAVRGTAARTLKGDGKAGVLLLDESVSTFESTAAATSFVANQVSQWRSCSGDSVTLVGDGNPLTMTVGQPASDGPVTLLRNSLDGSAEGFSSGRAIVAKSNVVIDVGAHGYDMGNALKMLADQIAARVQV